MILKKCRFLRNKRQRTKSVLKAHKKGIELERVLFYDLPSGTLEERSLSRVYGRTNLYRDSKDPTDVDHIEVKFSTLEQDASWVIRSIHQGLSMGRFEVSRRGLATLRKFIFLMHYRNEALSTSYFELENPRNAPLADWIRRFKETRQLKTEVDVWLAGLDYYLNTPHHEIVATGESLRERYGNQRLHEMLRRRFDPAIEEWYALDYESLANYFFLGVWEAAEGHEFVLGGNGFGLWEGLIYGSPGAHRLYVVSPRIALVLRRTFLHQPHSNDPSILYSCLADIPIPKPTVDHADKEFLQALSDADPEMVKIAFNTYRNTPKAHDDLFTFHITKLTDRQTYAVNEVIMMNANLHHNGSLTFSSPDIMLGTLEAYMTSHNTFLGGKRSLFRPLRQELLRMKQEDIPPSFLPNDREPLFLGSDTDADHQLNILLRFTIMKGIDFPSAYNRAYLVFHMATDGGLSNTVSSRIRKIRETAIFKLISHLDPPLPSFASSRPVVIVETLSQEESELFFAIIGHLVDQLHVGSHSNDLLANIIYESAIIGVTEWLVRERTDVLDLLLPWVSIVT